MGTHLKSSCRQFPWPSAARKFCVFVVFAAACPNSEARAGDKLPDLETIRTAVDLYAQTVKTLQGKCVETMSRDRTVNLPQPAAFDVLIETSFAADLVQRRTLLDSQESYYIVGKKGEKMPFEIRRACSYDGARSYHRIFTHLRSPVETEVEAGALHMLNIFPRDDTRTERVAWDYAGLRMSMAGEESLSTCLRKPGVTVEGLDEIDGARCVRLRARVGQGQAQLNMWLDSAHDFLPRRLELWRTPLPTKGDPELLYRMEVFKYRKFPDATGGEQWFPVRSRSRLWTKQIYDCEVTELQINPPLEVRRFAVSPKDLPDGVQVNNFSSQQLRPEYTGGRADLWKERDRLSDEESARIRALRDGP